MGVDHGDNILGDDVSPPRSPGAAGSPPRPSGFLRSRNGRSDLGDRGQGEPGAAVRAVDSGGGIGGRLEGRAAAGSRRSARTGSRRTWEGEGGRSSNRDGPPAKVNLK